MRAGAPDPGVIWDIVSGWFRCPAPSTIQVRPLPNCFSHPWPREDLIRTPIMGTHHAHAVGHPKPPLPHRLTLTLERPHHTASGSQHENSGKRVTNLQISKHNHPRQHTVRLDRSNLDRNEHRVQLHHAEALLTGHNRDVDPAEREGRRECVCAGTVHTHGQQHAHAQEPCRTTC
jgi:hypothetical protein